MGENLGKCLEWFSPPMVWDFTPKQAQNPVEVADHLKKGCLVYTRETQILAMYWGPAYIYQASVQHPQGSKRVSGSKTVAKPETQPSTITVAPVVKKKQWKRKSAQLEREEEAPHKREQEEDSQEAAFSAAEQPQEQEGKKQKP